MLKAELLQNYDEKIKFDYETGLILQNVPWSMEIVFQIWKLGCNQSLFNV